MNKKSYLPPASQAFAMQAESIVCQSLVPLVATEEWGEVDLSTL